jgi:hypothetical protein
MKWIPAWTFYIIAVTISVIGICGAYTESADTVMFTIWAVVMGCAVFSYLIALIGR